MNLAITKPPQERKKRVGRRKRPKPSPARQTPTRARTR